MRRTDLQCRVTGVDSCSQCDKRHPACFRCEKLGKPCPGYDKKRKFVDEGATLRRKYEGEVGRDSNGSDLADLSLNVRNTASAQPGGPSNVTQSRVLEVQLQVLLTTLQTLLPSDGEGIHLNRAMLRQVSNSMCSGQIRRKARITIHHQ